MRHPGGGNALTTRTAPPMDYQRIAEAFVHPIKLRILALMAGPPPARAPAQHLPEPGWSPNSLYVAVGEPLGNVSYHVRQLQKAGLIQLIATRQRRGALEHYYTLAR
jgi:DNA-binding transcriptional ArsR family regulator